MPNPLDNTLTLSLDYTNPMPIEEIKNLISKIVTYYAYIFNDMIKLELDINDYKFICDFFDSTNKHYNKSNFKERIDGLYLWDKMNIKNSSMSERSEISFFLRKIKRLDTKSKKTENLIRKYQHIISGTWECIKSGQILPIVKSQSSGGQPKPAA